MAENTALLVPMTLDAMVVVSEPRNFRRWQMNYTSLDYFMSPEPAAFSGAADDFTADPKNQGVYLLWTLPDALRHGRQAHQNSGKTQFPLLPNRWLVVRYNGALTQRTAKAWVVVSDYIPPGGTTAAAPGTSPYIHPANTIRTTTQLGQSWPLSDPTWTTYHADTPFLTAVSPGNPLFTAYQPNNGNVFSFHDDLTSQGISQDLLSYAVIGWYAEPGSDILASWQAGAPGQDFNDLLARLKWTQAAGGVTSQQSIYHAMVYGVNWNAGGPNPPSARDTANVSVAVGNTSVEALTALVKSHVAQGGSTLDPELLEAFQYNMLPLFDQPGGEELLRQRMRDDAFGSKNGGTCWYIVSREAAAGSTDPVPLSASEAQWLAQLNQDQTTLDRLNFRLSGLQRDLYELLWKQGYANNGPGATPQGVSNDQFNQALDPTNPTGLAGQVQALLGQIGAQQVQVPTQTAGQSLQDAADTFAAAKGMVVEHKLKPGAMPRLWLANDPVILVSGVNHNTALDPASTLACRSANQVTTGLTVTLGGQTTAVTTATVQSAIPALALTPLPPDQQAVVAALLAEFFFLDPNNATAIASVALHTSEAATVQALYTLMDGHASLTGTPPAPLPTAWVQPWLPLFFEWMVEWHPLPYQEAGQTRWSFNGADYDWGGVMPAAPAIQIVSGRALLTPKVAFTFKSQLEQFIQRNPGNADIAKLDQFISDTDHWDFLSQLLSGFMVQLSWRDPLANLAPDPQTAAGRLVGDAYHAVPQSLQAAKPHHGDLPPSTFEGLRGGQFVFRSLAIVDRFGQTIEVLTADQAKQLEPIVADSLKPTHAIPPEDPARWVQLPTRLLQAARLNFDLLSATDDTAVYGRTYGANPICGFVLPDHLDGGLAAYAPDGTYLGLLRLAIDIQGQPEVVWDSALGSTATPTDLAAQYPHLGGFLQALLAQTPDAFQQLLTVVDETLWTVDPLGDRRDQNLSVLIGRPLALVRARLQFELEQDPVRDPSWPYTFNPVNAPFPTYDLYVHLGNQLNRSDGLLGCFYGVDYTRFNSVYDPNASGPAAGGGSYLQQIGPGNYIPLRFDGQSAALLTLLVDPRAGVEAQTGLLPSKTLTIPQTLVADALRNLDVTFRTGPVLANLRLPAPDATNPNPTPTLLLPLPAEKNGTWSWLERNGLGELSLAAADAAARLPVRPPTLRAGWLKLRVQDDQ